MRTAARHVPPAVCTSLACTALACMFGYVVSFLLFTWAGNNAKGFVDTAFNILIPTPNNIQKFLNTQTGGKLSYMITSLLGNSAGEPLSTSKAHACIHL